MVPIFNRMKSENKNDVKAELISLLYKNAYFSIILSLIVACALGYQFLQEKDPVLALSWLITTLLILVYRSVTLYKFQKSPARYSLDAWKYAFYLGIFLMGLMWGMAGLFFNFTAEPEHWFFILFIISGLTGGGVSTLSPSSNAYIVFIIPVFTPIIVSTAAINYEHNIQMALLMSIYVIATIILSRRSHILLKDSIVLRISHEKMKKDAEINLELVQQHQVELYEKEEYLQAILDTALEGILSMNDKGIIEMANPAIEKIFGYTQDEIIGKNVAILMPEAISRFHQEKVDSYIDTKHKIMTGRKLETEARRKDGSTFPLSISVSENIINGKRIFTGVMSDITEQRNFTDALQTKNSELQYLSSHDELTGIYNRRSADEHLLREWDRAKRNNTTLSVLMVDVDNFKHYNDHYGHVSGDNCLQRVARSMRDNLHRPVDYLCRFGGEEFIIILPDTEIQGAIQVAENICKAIEDLKIPHEKSSFNYVTISIGVAATIPKITNGYEKLVSCADNALYKAKEQGRNRVESMEGKL